jgi:nucleotide-binding universal stress UspA family protein
MKLESVLVAVDRSPLALAAVERARALAGESGRVRLLHVVNTELLPRVSFIGKDLVEEFYQGVAAEAEIGLARIAQRFRDRGPTIERAVVLGRPADEIVAAARGFDVVIVGARATDAATRLVLGSVAEEVARRSPAPTLVVPDTARGASQVRRVLVAVDVVGPVAEVLEAADALASRLGARVEAIHVAPSPVRGDPEVRVRDGAPRAARKVISQTIGRSAAIHLAVGSPAREIVDSARPDDVIVCGARPRGALGRLALGSLATKLARRAPCPVLVARPSEPVARARVG